MRCFVVDFPENHGRGDRLLCTSGGPNNASPGQLRTDRDQGFDTTSVAAPNATQGRAATVLKLGGFGLTIGQRAVVLSLKPWACNFAATSSACCPELGPHIQIGTRLLPFKVHSVGALPRLVLRIRALALASPPATFGTASLLQHTPGIKRAVFAM